jgi:hypothetical protein
MARKMGRKGEKSGDINIIRAEATPLHTISEVTSLDNSLQFCNVQRIPNVPPVIAQQHVGHPIQKWNKMTNSQKYS